MPDELAAFGYRQELRRSLGGFSAFAAGFSFVSILTTVFQLVGGDPSVTSPTGAANAVLLGTLLLVFTTVVNAGGVRLMARINDVGVAAELLGVVVLITGLGLFAVRGPQVVLHDAPGTSAGI